MYIVHIKFFTTWSFQQWKVYLFYHCNIFVRYFWKDLSIAQKALLYPRRSKVSKADDLSRFSDAVSRLDFLLIYQNATEFAKYKVCTLLWKYYYSSRLVILGWRNKNRIFWDLKLYKCLCNIYRYYIVERSCNYILKLPTNYLFKIRSFLQSLSR